MRLSLKKCLTICVLAIIGLTNISWDYNRPSYFQSSNTNSVFSFTSYNNNTNFANSFEMVYDSLNLDLKGLSHTAFQQAIEGLLKLKEEGVVKNDSILTIVDFDQPSYNKRLYILDVKNFKILFNTWVAHGKNSGREWAQSFSNINESNKSSLGFYVTDETYSGSKGYSLKLIGLERNLNDHAFQRAIVLHGADYVSQATINNMGFIGRSHGCPAVPVELNKPIINKIKSGSCLFIYNRSYKSSLS